MEETTEAGFPILKYQLIKMSQGDLQDTFTLNFNQPFLIVGLHCPEISEAFEREFTMVNLRPYELAVNKFSGSDFLYDLAAMSTPGQRILERLDIVYDNTFNDGSDIIIVVSYLEFHN